MLAGGGGPHRKRATHELDWTSPTLHDNATPLRVHMTGHQASTYREKHYHVPLHARHHGLVSILT